MYIMILYVHIYTKKAQEGQTPPNIMFICPDNKIMGVIQFSSFYFHVV